jgi:UDP-N-acetylmuramate: L-alanyl-gamma-D-glutamyl-meso-diaminopimelate ligase
LQYYCNTNLKMKIHLIAIGGSIMHNLALALQQKGYHVTGSDDNIYEPAFTRLQNKGLLPVIFGWDSTRITSDIDIVILGMHAKPDNPELQKAMEMGLKVVSFPEFIYDQSKDKNRVVIAGSHGKTSVTAMVMHVLKKYNFDFDYAVGSSIEGFENSVRLSDSGIIIIEGDEYLSSPIDMRPKFMWYRPQIALINGIAWDHINVFPTYEIYLEQFRNFIQSIEAGKELIYYSDDEETVKLIEKYGSHLNKVSVSLPEHTIENGETTVTADDGKEYPISVFGKHNLQNLSGAQKICESFGVTESDFWKAAADFSGAGKRLEKIPNKNGITAFRDFAHAPSKVRATVHAVKNQFPDQKLVAVLELHTFSSLNKNFITQYADSLQPADIAIVYVDNHALIAKGGDTYSPQQISEAFKRDDILFFDAMEALSNVIKPYCKTGNTLLFMSSGNFGGMDIGGMVNG